ncbi:MAG: protein kinase, partial [Candidatus Delongbacteria bacterium]|nr:protein kinase [Candidatus Delongbacteria bacterium]MCG2761184.1 protein kinase [Candidatus Delongbacteria bacterium]
MQQGQKINDRYEIIRLLGEGGMGNVYLVKDFVENRVVALKLIKEKFFSNKAIDRFKNEFKLVSQLKHPNIIKVYDLDVYKETDTYFFTM